MTELSHIPADLPVPVDDGACDHLPGLALPDICLPCTNGDDVCMSTLNDLTAIFIYPMTGHPDKALPDSWNHIAGARGCTPQACGFRDNYPELAALNVHVLGLSTQSTSDQQEASNRLQLPYPLLSDKRLSFSNALRLPTFQLGRQTFIKRITLICNHGYIEQVFYPVFPPDKNAQSVIQYLQGHKTHG